MTTETRISPALKIVIWAVMLCSWLAQALAARSSLNADAVSYLDISYSCLRGNWHALVNGYWSPGYPLLLAALVKLFKVGPFREPLAVHLFAVASLIVALVSFEYFLSVFFGFRKKLPDENTEGLKGVLPDDAIRLVGYALFFWVSTFLTPPYLEQPDILVFILYLIAAALCMQLVSTSREWWRYALLGVVLGLAYLTKAVMFPLAFSFVAALLLCREWKAVLPRVLLTVTVFAAVSAPFVLELSKSKGRLTYGDVGVVNYRHIMGMDTLDTASSSESGSPVLPKPAATPHVQDFTEIIHLGTYPPWADPSYGYKGTPVHINFRRQLNRIHIVLRYYFDLYIMQLGALVTGFLALVIGGSNVREFGKRLLCQVPLWLPAVAGLALYALVRAEGRMLTGFTIGLFAACSAALRMEDNAWARRMSQSVLIAVSIVLVSQITITVGHEVAKYRDKDKFSDWEVATTLREMGVEPGERVGYMGDALMDHAWAHLARVKISAQIPDEDALSFWAAAQRDRVEAAKWLAATGARALVTRGVPATAMSMGWRRVGGTEYYVLMLSSLRE